MIAIASVLVVVSPISWILLHQPQNDDADASEPLVTRTDDTYITPTTKPVIAPPSSRVTTTPTVPPTATPTHTPTNSASPTTTPTTTPTERTSTDAPTTAPTEAPTSTGATNIPSTTQTQTTHPPVPTQTKTTTVPPPPPPPARDGGMNGDESQLFDMLDNVRRQNGCAPLEQDPNLTGSARSDALNRARSGSTNSTGSSKSTAGGDDWSAQQAYDQIMAQSRSTVLNCGLTTLGVGRKTHQYCKSPVLGLCLGATPTRVAWVADFS